MKCEKCGHSWVTRTNLKPNKCPECQCEICSVDIWEAHKRICNLLGIGK